MKRIGVVGLGYVGLPLALEFGKKYETIGFDVNRDRVQDLVLGQDRNLEASSEKIRSSKMLHFSEDIDALRECNIYIVTVPTPIDQDKLPDLTPLRNASNMIGELLSKGDIVIYESTVFPGATEEICVPILEKQSNLVFNKGFYCGYSPERINPGDKKNNLTSIKKVTSGSSPEIACEVDELYKSIINAGTHKVSSIKVAEASKVIENTQRDINIALVNELALIFNRLDIDTEEVLQAAGSKWNFLPFRPGLVGGHCIGVDPFYLTHKAIEVGYHPDLILAGRRVNDSMGTYVAEQVLRLMNKKRINVVDSNVLIMGLAFKENCPDLRNTRVTDLISVFKNVHCNIDVYDPWVNKECAKDECDILPIDYPVEEKYDAIVLAVAHDEIKKMGVTTLMKFAKSNCVIYDIKYIL
ncbi:nucleotide sugar dehydrogenase, partial [Gammaproteobacteria bacterium]|nr:nucleotide sugar dehydrogenase [Gammaproteobacteria bacterium]